jgi:hypothetical protein
MGTCVQWSGSAVTLFFSYIRYLNCLPGGRGASESGTWYSTCERLATVHFGVRGRSAMHGANTKRVAFSQPEIAKFRAANAHGALKDGLEYGRKITSRRTDDFEHFRGRGLLLLEFTQLAIALVKLLVEGRLAGPIGLFCACGRRLAGAGFLSRVPLRSPSTPPSRFNPPPAKNGLFSILLQHGFGGLGTGATTG